jgi:ABC-2 type transport system permease protein
MSAARPDFIAFKTILGKEIRRFLRIWQQTILPPAITMSLYLVIFGNLIGTRVGEMGGFPYMDYIAPGVIMMAVITNSYSNVVSSFFGARYQRYVEEMLISPTPHAIILLGYVGGGVARGLVVGLVVTTVAMLLADLQLYNLLVTVVGWFHQCHLCSKLRRHRHRPDFCADTVDVSWRRFLLDPTSA